MRIEARWIELARESLVIGNRNGASIHNPFADARNLFAIPRACGNRVESPVNEHAKARRAPPLHACIALRGSFRVLDGLYAMCFCDVVVLAVNLGRQRYGCSETDRQ